ncbi:MAG: hypothetical protein C5B51_24585 [Terriglobia bacterium]|nr:MAG: hypothetical protein C5B51_24585 [Terriglobia bacterium]
MAKGWESKSAEALAGVFEVRRNAPASNVPDPATLNSIRQKESILLSRTRIVTELKATQNPRYRDLLNRTLADLDAKLSAL